MLNDAGMKRIFLLLILFLTTCSPPPGPAGKVDPVPEPVPYSKIDWKDDVHYHNGKPFTGVTVQYHKIGNLQSRYAIKDGVYHGLVEEWYESGQQKTKTSFESGKHEGDNFYWNPDGTLQTHKVWKGDHLISETPGTAKP